jgi:hypothetical protein
VISIFIKIQLRNSGIEGFRNSRRFNWGIQGLKKLTIKLFCDNEL